MIKSVAEFPLLKQRTKALNPVPTPLPEYIVSVLATYRIQDIVLKRKM